MHERTEAVMCEQPAMKALRATRKARGRQQDEWCGGEDWQEDADDPEREAQGAASDPERANGAFAVRQRGLAFGVVWLQLEKCG